MFGLYCFNRKIFGRGGTFSFVWRRQQNISVFLYFESNSDPRYIPVVQLNQLLKSIYMELLYFMLTFEYKNMCFDLIFVNQIWERRFINLLHFFKEIYLMLTNVNKD